MGAGQLLAAEWVKAGATVALALDPKVALGLVIPNRATAANTTTYIGAGDALGLRSWERKLRGGQGDSWCQWIDGSAVVALESKATLLLAILNKAAAINTTNVQGKGLRLV